MAGEVGCLGEAGVQPFADLLGCVGAPSALLPDDHYSGCRDPDKTGQSQHLPPLH